MQREIYPSDMIENVTETYLPQVSARGQIIYLTVICALLAGFAALPFIRIEVSVQSPAVIRASAERSELRHLTGGRIKEVLVKENQSVVQGQALFRLKTDMTESKVRLLKVMETEKTRYVSDLKQLIAINLKHPVDLSLSSALYLHRYDQFVLHTRELEQTMQKRKRDLETNSNLFSEKVIARQELEDKEFEFKVASAQLDGFVERQINEWQGELSRFQMELLELHSEQKQLQLEIDNNLITAPVTGTIGQMIGKYPGIDVQPGELLAVISPDSNLVAECYVSTKDIGLLRVGMKCRIQVDAYDYNQWGMAEGKIISVSNDVAQNDKHQVYFKVICKLSRDYLTMKMGVKGRLKKGMTLHTNFVVTERSLYDLLYDQADDWLNPRNDSRIQ